MVNAKNKLNLNNNGENDIKKDKIKNIKKPKAINKADIEINKQSTFRR